MDTFISPLTKSRKAFCFELSGRIFAYQTLAQDWASNAYLFRSKISSSLEVLPCVNYVDDILVGGKDKRS